MLTIRVPNVNHALPIGLDTMRAAGILRPSRAGDVLEYPSAVATTYTQPDRCVLFDAERDANPFFHFMEALWILAGRNDVATLRPLLNRIAEFSDNGKTFHGAYGFRLRGAFGIDQIAMAIAELRKDHTTRRVVMSIYNPTLDLTTASKDIPCNDMVMLKIRDGRLHMTVCNRSNDVIWGAYGANAVQFSFLMQYIAAKVGVTLGEYNQVSDSYHVYTDNPYWQLVMDRSGVHVYDPYEEDAGIKSTVWPFFQECDGGWLDTDLKQLFIIMARDQMAFLSPDVFKSPLISHCAVPLYNAHLAYRSGLPPEEVLRWVEYIGADDWRAACRAWVARRYLRRLSAEA